MKLTIDLPKDTLFRLAVAAHEADVTLNAYIQTTLYRGKEAVDEPQEQVWQTAQAEVEEGAEAMSQGVVSVEARRDRRA